MEGHGEEVGREEVDRGGEADRGEEGRRDGGRVVERSQVLVRSSHGLEGRRQRACFAVTQRQAPWLEADAMSWQLVGHSVDLVQKLQRII